MKSCMETWLTDELLNMTGEPVPLLSPLLVYWGNRSPTSAVLPRSEMGTLALPDGGFACQLPHHEYLEVCTGIHCSETSRIHAIMERGTA
jgi:hypothetical protein